MSVSTPLVRIVENLNMWTIDALFSPWPNRTKPEMQTQILKRLLMMTQTRKTRRPTPPPPIPVFADIECYQDEDRVFHAHLICWSSAEEDEIHHSDKIEDFLVALEVLTEVEGDERERKVVSFFHNMRGFDGNFILEKLYDQGRAVEKPLRLKTL